MNHFTKEELEDLYICCTGGTYDDHPLENWKVALQSKIQSMIDSYCHHKPHGDFHVCVDKCKKCGIIIEDNP